MKWASSSLKKFGDLPTPFQKMLLLDEKSLSVDGNLVSLSLRANVPIKTPRLVLNPLLISGGRVRCQPTIY